MYDVTDRSHDSTETTTRALIIVRETHKRNVFAHGIDNFIIYLKSSIKFYRRIFSRHNNAAYENETKN